MYTGITNALARPDLVPVAPDRARAILDEHFGRSAPALPDEGSGVVLYPADRYTAQVLLCVAGEYLVARVLLTS